MRRSTAAILSAAFFAVAPGTVVGLIPASASSSTDRQGVKHSVVVHWSRNAGRSPVPNRADLPLGFIARRHRRHRSQVIRGAPPVGGEESSRPARWLRCIFAMCGRWAGSVASGMWWFP